MTTNIKIEKISSSSKDELISKLNKREIFWIKNYNSYKDGYNDCNRKNHCREYKEYTC